MWKWSQNLQWWSLTLPLNLLITGLPDVWPYSFPCQLHKYWFHLRYRYIYWQVSYAHSLLSSLVFTVVSIATTVHMEKPCWAVSCGCCSLVSTRSSTGHHPCYGDRGQVCDGFPFTALTGLSSQHQVVYLVLLVGSQSTCEPASECPPVWHPINNVETWRCT